jgi:endoglucanase
MKSVRDSLAAGIGLHPAVLLLAALCLSACACDNKDPLPGSWGKGFLPYHRGVTIAGAEFGTGPPWAPDFSNENPGTHGSEYWYNSEATFRYFGQKDLTLLRIALRWERIQPQLSQPLDAAQLALLKQDIAWAKMYGCRVIIDIHNYGRYFKVVNTVRTECIIDNQYDGAVQVSTADFCDLWVRLSAEFASEPTAYAYGLMCEPHDMGTADWKSISQACLTAVRNAGDNKLVFVSGDSWSSAHMWLGVHGSGSWISDPADNFAYEAHCYFDSDNSGAYAMTYDEELALDSGLPDRGRDRLRVFTDWCSANGVRGFLGEYGVPNDDPRWCEVVLERFLADLDGTRIDGCCWAAGEWWGDYKLSVQPEDSFSADRPQLAILRRHLGAP